MIGCLCMLSIFFGSVLIMALLMVAAILFLLLWLLLDLAGLIPCGIFRLVRFWNRK